MGIILVKVIYANGLLQNNCQKSITCSGGGVKAGYIVPVGDCCTDATEYAEFDSINAEGAPSTAIHGIWIIDSDGTKYLCDVQGGTEAFDDTVDNTIMEQKLNKALLACQCTDCGSTTPVTTIDPQYDGVYPSEASAICVNVTRAGTSADDAVQVTIDYAPFALGAITIRSKSGSSANVVYTFQAKELPPVLRTGDVVAVC